MKTLQLFKAGKEIIATDGIMHVDGRFNISSIKREVTARNKRFEANFPHKLADSFAVYQSRIGSKLSSIITL